MITTMTQKGQVTIPVSIRNKLGITPGQKVSFSLGFGQAIVKPILHWTTLRGSIKSNRRFSQKLLREEEKAAEEQAVREYLAKSARMEKQGR